MSQPPLTGRPVPLGFWNINTPTLPSDSSRICDNVTKKMLVPTEEFETSQGPEPGAENVEVWNKLIQILLLSSRELLGLFVLWAFFNLTLNKCGNFLVDLSKRTNKGKVTTALASHTFEQRVRTKPSLMLKLYYIYLKTRNIAIVCIDYVNWCFLCFAVSTVE